MQKSNAEEKGMRLRGKLAASFVTAALVTTGILGAVSSLVARPSGPAGIAKAIVFAAPGRVHSVSEELSGLGAQDVRSLGIINAVSVRVPAAELPLVVRQAGVTGIAPDRSLSASSATYSPTTDTGSLYNTTLMTGARQMWSKGYTGAGVGIALIDSGVAPVPGLDGAGKVVYGPDLSYSMNDPNQLNLDAYGHGTHLAGIIAGRDAAAVSGQYVSDTSDFLGMAPDATLVSIKAGDYHGSADISQIIAGLDWVYQHHADPGVNIRIVELAWGGSVTGSYLTDPLAYAAEILWRNAGVLVVAAAGNGGSTSGGVADPAYDPYLLAVGAADTQGTNAYNNDTVASFSSYGDGTRNVDMVAPGVHIESLDVPGSYVDSTYDSSAGVGGRFILGSGTSQASAVVAGGAALLLQQKPNLNPDQLKQLLMSTSVNLTTTSSKVGQGKGEINLAHAMTTSVGSFSQNWQQAQPQGSLGTLEASGGTWSGGSWSGGSWTGGSWSGGTWSAGSWTAGTYTGGSWTGGSWTGGTWTGGTWSGGSWTGGSWSGGSWTGGSWSGGSWSGGSWSGGSWTGGLWEVEWWG